MKALAFGEVLWDVGKGEEFIGGAPLNVLAHLSRLGVETAIITGLGDDSRGNAALQVLGDFHIATGFVQTMQDQPTGVAIATLDENGTATYELPLSAYDNIKTTPELMQQVHSYNADLFYFGTLAQRNLVSACALREILDMVNAKHIFYDINIRMDFYPLDILENSLRQATIFKINDEEAELVSQRLYGKTFSLEDFAKKIARDYTIGIILITLGKDGCLVYDGSGFSKIAGEAVDVADTIGAGDSFSAAFLWALFQGNTPAKAVECGNIMGGYVASRSGAVPVYIDGHMDRILKYKRQA